MVFDSVLAIKRFIWYFNRDLRTAILTAAVATVLVYGLFVEILGIRLPSGLLFG